MELVLYRENGGKFFVLKDNSEDDGSNISKTDDLGIIAEFIATEYPDVSESIVNDFSLNVPVKDINILLTPSETKEFLCQLEEYHYQTNGIDIREITNEEY